MKNTNDANDKRSLREGAPRNQPLVAGPPAGRSRFGARLSGAGGEKSRDFAAPPSRSHHFPSNHRVPAVNFFPATDADELYGRSPVMAALPDFHAWSELPDAERAAAIRIFCP
jgi:hypothetical protein